MTRQSNDVRLKLIRFLRPQFLFCCFAWSPLRLCFWFGVCACRIDVWLPGCMPLWFDSMLKSNAFVGPILSLTELLLLCSDSRRTTTTSPVVHAKVAIVTAFGEPSKDWPLTSGGSRNNPLHSSSPSEEEEPTLPVWAAKQTTQPTKRIKEKGDNSKPDWLWHLFLPWIFPSPKFYLLHHHLLLLLLFLQHRLHIWIVATCCSSKEASFAFFGSCAIALTSRTFNTNNKDLKKSRCFFSRLGQFYHSISHHWQ